MSLIFSLNFFLSKSTSKFGVLLGNFLKFYTNATDTEIGLVLSSVPIVMTIAKPILCTMMDRLQAHKTFLILSYGFLCLGYVPFVVIPFLGPSFYNQNSRLCLYTLTAFNIIADVGSAVVETLDDTLAVNYAKQVGSRFTLYRMWGTISYGLISLLIGQVNDGFWIVPKYTAVYIFLLVATLFMMLLIHIWPDEHFKIAPCSVNQQSGILEPLKSDELGNINITQVMRQRLLRMLKCYGCNKNSNNNACKKSSGVAMQEATKNNITENTDLAQYCYCCSDFGRVQVPIFDDDDDANNHNEQTIGGNKMKQVPKLAQLRIFVALLVQDPRIVAYFGVIAFCGVTLQLQYFLYAHLTGACTTENGCNYSQLTGYMLAAAAFSECLMFLVSEPLVWRIGRLATLKLAMFALVARYGFYGTLYRRVSAYWAIVAEVAFGAVTGVYSTIKPEIAYMFANEVSLVLPELVRSGKVSLSNVSIDSLKACLASTMQGAFSLVYSGLGRSVGALIAGLIIGMRHNYEDLWLFSAMCCFVVGSVFAAIKLLGMCFDLRPKLIKQATTAQWSSSPE